jgi:hypothetical protein
VERINTQVCGSTATLRLLFGLVPVLRQEHLKLASPFSGAPYRAAGKIFEAFEISATHGGEQQATGAENSPGATGPHLTAPSWCTISGVLDGQDRLRPLQAC